MSQVFRPCYAGRVRRAGGGEDVSATGANVDRMGERASQRPAGSAPRPSGTWLGGVRSAGADLGHPGAGIGLPEEGPGAAAPYGRRLLALLLDWGLSWLVAALLVAVAGSQDPATRSAANLAVFAVEVWVLTATAGVTAGKLLCGLRVRRLDGRPVGFGWSLARTLLLLAVLPALLWDRDHRGMHDRATGTVVVRA